MFAVIKTSQGNRFLGPDPVLLKRDPAVCFFASSFSLKYPSMINN